MISAFVPDQDLARGNVVGVFRTGSSEGATDVKEAYVEFLAPVLRDAFLAKSLDINAAYRYSDYNLAGGVDTYKGDFSWSIVDAGTLRGGYQRAVRAPSVGELFVAPERIDPGYRHGGEWRRRSLPLPEPGAHRCGRGAGTERCARARELHRRPRSTRSRIRSRRFSRPAAAIASSLPSPATPIHSAWYSGRHSKVELLSQLQLSVDWYQIEIEMT